MTHQHLISRLAAAALLASVVQPVLAQPGEITEIAVGGGCFWGCWGTIQLGGIWPTDCVPHSPTISLAADRIRVRVSTHYDDGTHCLQEPTPWVQWATILLGVDSHFCGLFDLTTQIDDHPPVPQRPIMGVFCLTWDSETQHGFATDVRCTPEGGLVGIAAGVVTEAVLGDAVVTVVDNHIHLHITPDPDAFGVQPRLRAASAVIDPRPDGLYTVTTQWFDEPPVARPPVAVRCACRPDWNFDGAADSSDVSAFITSWLSSITTSDLLADFDGDGQVNSADISAFITAWLAAVHAGGC